MNITRALLSIVSVTVLTSGCVSHSAPDFPKSWKPMNQLSDQIVEIPLIKLHSYEVTQLDSTVKGLLERWGEEARMSVIYDHPIDFTLYKKVKSIHATELRVALNELTQLYSDKNMVFYIQDNVIMAHGKMEEGEGSKNISNKKIIN